MEFQTLVSLPPAAARLGRTSLALAAHVDSDPPARQLGSGGGTAHLLFRAWKNLAPAASFSDWIAVSQKLIIHASGHSRHLPAYAAEGKSRIPLPPLASYTGQNAGQSLLDIQHREFTHLLRHAPAKYRVAVTCGNILVRHDAAMPPFPDADILLFGVPAAPEEASAHGTLFSPRTEESTLSFFLQKPSPEKIRSLSGKYRFLVDSGVWLFSERALMLLFKKCGWDASSQRFSQGMPACYDLYNTFSASLGNENVAGDPEISALSVAVVPLPQARFYHFGNIRAVLASLSRLSAEPGSKPVCKTQDDASRVILYSRVPAGLPDSVTPLWIENAFLPDSWNLSRNHILTGIPENSWALSLPPGICIDSLPFARSHTATASESTIPEALRVYGFDDSFHGTLSDLSTLWMGTPFVQWLRDRGISFEEAGLSPACEIQDAPLFPLISWNDEADARLLRWMIGSPGKADNAADARARWLAATRVSATDLVQKAVLAPRLQRRTAAIHSVFENLSSAQWAQAADFLDLAATAATLRSAPKIAGNFPPPLSEQVSQLAPVHDTMLRVALGQKKTSPDMAFSRLSRLMVHEMELQPTDPHCDVREAQIVWGRAPARLDLAGGWTDTPPYCIEHGGRVVNAAVDLNGQPPIQAFARICKEPKIILRSIDLGLEETIDSFEALRRPPVLGAPFTIHRGAFRMAGFDPQFHVDGCAKDLSSFLLSRFDGGIELSTVCAIPKGSGLGTSSILASTILGVLGNLCGLSWSSGELFTRTLALQQLLTAGGGWQDQMGGVAPGVKYITTQPGMLQTPDIRYLPDRLFNELLQTGRALLFYTGVTRVSHSILSGIVQSIFLNHRHTLSCIEDIACNADFCATAIERADADALGEAIMRSFALNRTLDIGTLPASLLPVTSLLDRHGASYKLLGAGGCGYLFIITPDRTAADNIRAQLSQNPLNAASRFVDFSLSRGLQITRS